MPEALRRDCTGPFSWTVQAVEDDGALTRLADVAATLDPARVRRRGPIARALGPLGAVADVLALLDDGGVADGAYLRTWLDGVLTDLGVSTFADLRLRGDAAQGVPQVRRGRARADVDGEVDEPVTDLGVTVMLVAGRRTARQRRVHSCVDTRAGQARHRCRDEAQGRGAMRGGGETVGQLGVPRPVRV